MRFLLKQNFQNIKNSLDNYTSYCIINYLTGTTWQDQKQI